MPYNSFDNYDMEIKVGFACLTVPFVVVGIFSIAALSRTRKIPETARFLAKGLIVQDIIGAGGITVRKFMTTDAVNIFIHVTSINCLVLAYLTIGMMTLERLIIFYSPHFYLRHVSPTMVKRIAYTVWALATTLYFTFRFLVCYFKLQSFPLTLYNVTGQCNVILNNIYFGIGFFVIMLSILCYLKIFIIIKREKLLSRTTLVSAKQYKSTSAVLMFLIIILLTTIAYLVCVGLKLSNVNLRHGIDAIAAANCVLDPLVYVFWFRECRMEILKMLAVCLPNTPYLHVKVEQMRVEIFAIYQ